MPDYLAQVLWRRRSNESFLDGRYSREHEYHFDGGVIVPASSAVHSVPEPYSNPRCVDPEEAFVAAISSCHLLTFLYLAAKGGLVVDRYTDQARGTMGCIAGGRQALTCVLLSPQIAFSGELAPNETQIEHLHHAAHEECYIANSVRCEILIQGRWSYQF